MKRLSLIAATVAFLFGACERHSWEDQDKNKDGRIDQNEKGTKRLYQDDHGKEGEAHKEEGHGEGEGGEKGDGEEKAE